jgi:hypothetical protein
MQRAIILTRKIKKNQPKINSRTPKNSKIKPKTNQVNLSRNSKTSIKFQSLQSNSTN